MKLDMNFNFDTSTPGDESVMQKVCAVLAGADAKTVTTEAAPLKVEPIVIPKEVIEKLVEKIKENATEAQVEKLDSHIAEVVETQIQREQPTPKFDPETATDVEMTAMKTDDLLAVCEELGIDPKKTAGVNTNKKIRTLILDWQKSSASKPTVEEDDEHEAPAASATTIEPMGLVEARTLIEPFFNTADRKAVVQKLMIEHGAKKVNAAGQTVCSLGVLDAEGKDYRPLVNAIVNYPYGK